MFKLKSEEHMWLVDAVGDSAVLEDGKNDLKTTLNIIPKILATKIFRLDPQMLTSCVVPLHS